MKILVLGGSRFLGKTFVETALNQNHEVTIFNRGTRNEELKEVEILTGDRYGDLSALKGRNWDAVLDTSGLAPHTVRRATDILKDNVGQYTYISSISVYKDWVPTNITEDYPVHTMSSEEADKITLVGPDFSMEYYGAFKAISEMEAENNMPSRVMNVRAGQLVGPHDYTDRLPYWIDRVAKGGKVLVPGRPDRPVQLVDNLDLANWFLKMMEQGKGGTFNSTGPDYTLTMSQLLEHCKAISGSDAEFEWVDESFIRDNNVAPWTELPLWIPETYPLSEGEEPWRGTFSINVDKAISSGLTFRPIEETLKDVYKWHLERQHTSFEWRAGITLEREKDLLAKWSLVKS
ncbi:NAD-dependent epimerase/dehydratase family protein [Bacillus sp. 31A1R]|uniref:NAD-dependent epimerase/dehydratase family protein n=1 Tax=Robertmurraya mangrovi TaxID=3098077 RepID=A0ABU5J035_9BACI|nr:NAD-dependent epimerase/dehydratase family protein [Bacillus sp. 31A1R]MDZ5472751.1 NAD-dependent epimerase/dehydratase family protein [Bacillus sp. 31A1R]